MAADTELDRNEAATPHKLSEARKRGQVTKSSDVVSAAVFAAAVAYFYARGWETLRAQFLFDRAFFSEAAVLAATPAGLWQLIDAAIRESMLLLAPFLATVVLAAVAANVAQIGGVFSSHPITPDWSRINPVNGLKRVFSMRTLFDAARVCAKLVVLAWVVYASLEALLPQFNRLAGLAPLGHARLLVGDAASLGLKMALAMALVAAIDFGFTRHESAKRLRMSRREVKDEFRQREGDPRIRGRLRELRRDMLRRSLSLRRTRDADVVLTNPTHFAVALRYRHGEMAAPRLVAKGAGAMAAAMRKIAARHGIPVVENRTLARALYRTTAIDEDLPSAFFADVARIMVWILAMRRARDSAAGSAASAVAAESTGVMT